MISPFIRQIIFTLGLFFLALPCARANDTVVNVYNWAGSIPQAVIAQFEGETGIKVNYDVYDSSEVMETKLMAGHSGYDVVGVTVWPYLSRQLQAHLYQRIQFDLVPNVQGIGEDFLKRMDGIDPGNVYALPYVWGTSGFAYNRQMIEARFPDAPKESLAMLFDPQVVSRFADCGVVLLDSPVEIFPAMLRYLRIDPNSQNVEDLKLASQHLAKVRPYVKKFQAVPSPQDLTSKDVCLVQGFSGELLVAMRAGKKKGVDIQYVMPKEGTALWVDALAIPKGAPHLKAAHKFINFLLRPEIAAKVTNSLYQANCIPASLAYIDKDIKENPLIYPSQKTMETLYVDQAPSPQYERLRLREWTRVKTGR